MGTGRPARFALAVLVACGPGSVAVAATSSVPAAAAACTDLVTDPTTVAPDAATLGPEAPEPVRVVAGDAPDEAGTFDPDELVFGRSQPDGAERVSATRLDVPGGRWSLDAVTGDVTFAAEPETDDTDADTDADAGAADGEGGEDPVVFTPEDGYAGPARGGDAAEPALRVVTSCDALGLPDSARTDQGVEVSLDPLANDAGGRFDAGGSARPDEDTLTFDADDLPEDWTLSDDAHDLRVPGEGSWSVDDGTVTFAPVARFAGRASPVRYVARDTARHRLGATMRVVVDAVTPTAEPDTARTAYGTTVVLDVLANDDAGAGSAPLDPDTLRLADTDAESEGTWAVTDEGVEFAPTDGFTGPTEAVRYVVDDANGTTTGATAEVVVEPELRLPDAFDDVRRTPYETPVRLDVLDNDEPRADGELDPATLRLIGPGNRWRLRLVMPGEGVWSVTPLVGEDRELRFVPADGYVGRTTRVRYRVVDDTENAVTAGAVVVVEEPGEALPTEVSTTRGTPVEVDVLEAVTPAPSEDLRPRTLCVLPRTVRVDGTRLASDRAPDRCLNVHRRADVGRWDVARDGEITFTPAAGFTGRTVLGFRVADTGGDAYRSTLSVEVTAPTSTPRFTSSPATTTPSTGTTTPSTGATTPTTPSTSPYGSGLPDTGGPTALALVAGLAMLIGGGLVLRRSRRRA